MTVGSRESGPARAIGIALAAGTVGIWLSPWVGRLARPSLLSDDVLRLVVLQRVPLPSRLVLPFNEHLAPAFELVSTVAWHAAGRRLEWAPMAFTVASIVPFLACLAALRALARAESGSRTASMLAVTLFAGSPIYAECVGWYSASSFCWALLPTLIALRLAARSGEGGGTGPGPGRLGAIAACCLLAPMGSAVGLFAGPAVAARLWACPGAGRSGWARALLPAAAPLAGTAAYLAFAGVFGLDEVVSESVRDHRDPIGGLARGVEAPAFLVLAGFLGVRDASLPPSPLLWAVTMAGVAAASVAGITGDAASRRRVLAAAMLIAPPYAGIFCVRAGVVGSGALLHNTRYHLFPCVGVVLLATSAAAPMLRRLDGGPVVGRLAVAAVGLALLAVNGPKFDESLALFSSFRGQRETLGALDRLAGAARDLGVGRDRIVRAFDPVVPRWSSEGGNILELLPETGTIGEPAHPGRSATDAEVRSALLAALEPEDRAALLGGLDASAYLDPMADAIGGGAPRPIPGSPGASRLMLAEGAPEHYRAGGWPGFLEFEFGAGDRPAEAIVLPPIAADQRVQLWWAAADGSWSASRSVTLPPPEGPSVLRLADLPHWDGSDVPAVRIVFPRRGPVALGAPALLR